MIATASKRTLESTHTKDAIEKRIEANLKSDHYLGDFLLGAIDGTVTTFALVAGVTGAGLAKEIAIILGVANLIADGFSMAASNYQKAKSDAELLESVRHMEEEHIERIPHGEIEEVRHIYTQKGFSGPLLEKVIEVIISDRKQWVDTMIQEEHGMPLRTPNPIKSALSTFFAFLLIGFIPVLPFFLPFTFESEKTFLISAIATGLAFFGIGFGKGKVLAKNPLLSGLETFFIGGAAATMAYLVSAWLKNVTGLS